jgi:hypothetical protein
MKGTLTFNKYFLKEFNNYFLKVFNSYFLILGFL